MDKYVQLGDDILPFFLQSLNLFSASKYFVYAAPFSVEDTVTKNLLWIFESIKRTMSGDLLARGVSLKHISLLAPVQGKFSLC
jgi:hypothetical protein